MKYKVGDRVKIKSLDWYNENKDKNGDININGLFSFNEVNKHLCGTIMTIRETFGKSYMVKENDAFWTDEMIEGLVEEGTIDLTSIVMQTVEEKTIQNALTYGYNLPKDYIFKDENGNVINATKIVLEKKKKEYPKTYEECYKVLGIEYLSNSTLKFFEHGSIVIGQSSYQHDNLALINTFIKLKLCRDAYWKIAGEEMGLGKPWKPDWNDISDKYCIYFVCGDAWSKECQTRQCPFAFPTPAMRDMFKENFKLEIESCKEFL